MSASWRSGDAKIGRMSSKSMPGDGKSGNWRSADFSCVVRLASCCLGGPALTPCALEPALLSPCIVGSAVHGCGCDAVEGLSMGCVEGPVLSGCP